MSNRRRLRPPATVAASARAYRCGHCQSVTGRPRRATDGIWHLSVYHDLTCPVLNRAVSPAPSSIRSLSAAAAATGKRFLYIGPDGQS
jgi:hypothetical protein